MDRLTFVAELVAALAWPVTVLACVLLLRGFVTALVPLLRKLKYSDLELQFGREVAERPSVCRPSSSASPTAEPVAVSVPGG